ncbi:class I SAM-dependent methyltransferase [Ekhidna sp. To15]|uniref:class I SAM-dependent methyltransferase n=1 Tax=Ekhidna sp. To15 TaxID=3395267 RepID=UPI003F51FF28
MSLKCPICEHPLFDDNGHLKCDEGHHIENKYGVHILHEPSFAKWYVPFESKFQAYRERENIKIKNASTYDRLPYVSNDLGKASWKAKARDLLLIKKYLKGKSNLNILEIGAWNCWLTNHLNHMGHSVTAVDYFIDPYDGLGAKQHYSNHDWMAIQMNLERLDLIAGRYDLIIINRMIVYFEDPFKTLQKLINENLTVRGEMLVTGVIMTANKELTTKAFNKEMDDFEKKEGFSIKIKEFFGAFTETELERVKKMGFRTYKYRKNLLSYLKELIEGEKSWQMHFAYQEKGLLHA